MNIQNRPVVGSTTPRAYTQPPAVGGGAPITVAVNNYQVQSASAGGVGILAKISSVFGGFVNAVKNFFGKLFGASSAPVAPSANTGSTAPSTGAAGDDATLSAQFGLLNTPQNVAAFRQALGAAQAEAGVIGPGSTNAEAVLELQQVLAGWGFAVQQNGQFDPATADAVIRFKAANGLSEGFVFANGQPGATPFIDTKTRAKMVELLTSASAPSTGTPAASTPTPAPATPAVDANAALAAKLHLAPDAANMAAYQAAAAALVAQGALGPDNMPAEAIGELQSVLASWGYAVQPTGQFDQATIDGLLKFKLANNLTDARFKMADGQVGVAPFVDEATQAVMIAKLQGAQPAQPPAAQQAAPQVPATNQYQAGLSAEDAAIAQSMGILATPANVAAFKGVAAALNAETEVVGPDTNSNPAAVQELQQVLAGWGYAVQQTGQFDQATVNAVLKFKRDKGITYNYQMADGTAGVHPYIDSRTKDVMIKLLGG